VFYPSIKLRHEVPKFFRVKIESDLTRDSERDKKSIYHQPILDTVSHGRSELYPFFNILVKGKFIGEHKIFYPTQMSEIPRHLIGVQHEWGNDSSTVSSGYSVKLNSS